MDITDRIIKIQSDIGMSGKVVAMAMEIPYGTFIKRRYRTQRFTQKNLNDLKNYLQNKVNEINKNVDPIAFHEWVRTYFWHDDDNNIYYKSMREYKEGITYDINQVFEIYVKKQTSNNR